MEFMIESIPANNEQNKLIDVPNNMQNKPATDNIENSSLVESDEKFYTNLQPLYASSTATYNYEDSSHTSDAMQTPIVHSTVSKSNHDIQVIYKKFKMITNPKSIVFILTHNT